ncbi:MAG: hypothetical protein ACHQ52_14090, partial [Candidatus Eisenbacteria bacterium]
MLQFLIGTDIPFMRYRRFTYFFSGALILATAVWLALHGGPKYSVDFTGGTLLQIRTDRVVAPDQMRAALDQAGLKGLELQQLTGQNTDEYMIRMKSQSSADPFPPIKQALESRLGGVKVEFRGTAAVGPKVGSELRQKAIWAVL